MGNAAYLLIAASVIILGICILALRGRAPRGVDSGIRDHQRHMGALSVQARRNLIAHPAPPSPPTTTGQPPSQRTE
jgi:hypothetical protein